MFSVWLGILTPASEGDKKQGRKSGKEGEIGLRKGLLVISHCACRTSPDKKPPWKATAGAAGGGRGRDGGLLWHLGSGGG